MTSHSPEPLVFHPARLPDADRDRLIAALVDDRPFVLPPAAVLDPPLFSRREVARMQRVADRATIALIGLVVVVFIIQLGRLLIGGGA